MHDKELFLCPPLYLELKYEINPWMDTSQPFDKQKAHEQWWTLVELYQKLAPRKVHILPPRKGLTELCFVGDSVFAVQNKALYGNFRHPEREPERHYVVEMMTTWGFSGRFVPQAIRYEGSGETMLWRDSILFGFGQRSHEEARVFLEQTFHRKVHGFEMELERFYHLDTALFPLDDDLIVYFPNAFGPIDTETLNSLDCELLPITEEEARGFACNSIVFEDHVITHTESKSFIRTLQKRGYSVIPTDISEFLKLGGGLKCLTLQHYL